MKHKTVFVIHARDSKSKALPTWNSHATNLCLRSTNNQPGYTAMQCKCTVCKTSKGTSTLFTTRGFISLLGAVQSDSLILYFHTLSYSGCLVCKHIAQFTLIINLDFERCKKKIMPKNASYDKKKSENKQKKI